ncbi:hypothetical protein [Streptomyces sp. NPDC001480]|uniref:hypothetical protein n=1 Tax=Streptomyces sp. NPDC001480 TaxID=3364577 RepID=UPI0036BDBB89
MDGLGRVHLASEGPARSLLRRFLDRELSAGAHSLRKNYRARYHDDQLLLPGPGVGTEASTVGTAIDYRLRLAFTAVKPVDPVAILGMLHLGMDGAGQRMRAVGKLDNRDLPIDRDQDEEEDLARLLLAAARPWRSSAAAPTARPARPRRRPSTRSPACRTSMPARHNSPTRAGPLVS